MSDSRRSLLFWLPRLLAIVFAALLSIFAADAFSEGSGLLDTLLQVTLHLVPALIVLAVLAVAWRREWVGAIAFFAMAVDYVVTSWGRFPLSTYFVIAGPLVVLAVLFLLSGRARRPVRPDPA